MEKFISRLSVILNSQAKHLTKRRSTSVIIGLFPFVARTDGLKIMINQENDIYQTIKDDSKEVIFAHFKGLNYHEIGHIIFSDFDKLKTSINAVMQGQFYPCPPTPRNDTEEIYLESLKDSVKSRMFVTLFKNITNIVEDIWMELKVMQSFPGTKASICFNEKKLLENIPDFEDMKSALEKCHNLLLKYARGGHIEADEEFEEFMADVTPLVDKAVTTDSFDKRCEYVNQILLALYPLYASELDNNDMADNIDNQTPDHSDESPDPSCRQSSGNSNDTNSSVDGSSENSSEGSNESKSNESDDPDNCDKTNDGNSSNGKGSSQKKKPSLKKKDEEEKESQNASENELKNTRKQMSETIESIEENELLTPEDIRDLSKILKEIRKEDEVEKKEQAILKELKSREDGFTITRATPSCNPQDMKKYVRKFSQVLKVLAEDDGEEDELLFGQELDIGSLHRRDGKHFSSYDDKEEMSMSVCMMIDESGSMGGERKAVAEQCAIVLYDFCKEAHIPIAIYGHNCPDMTRIRSYTEFDSVDGQDRKRIHFEARGCNNDSKAFKFAKERIMERSENIRLLVMISDGQPSCEDYDTAKSKIQDDLKALKRAGVVSIAAAIGDDKPQIKDIYGSAFLDMSDLSKFPQKMLNIIQTAAGI